MEFEDSRLALFPEPNAYIQKFNNENNNKEIKKIVFQEPYETLPNYYLKNSFTKHDCECVLKSKQNRQVKNSNNHDNNCNPGDTKQNGSGFDLKSLLPILSLFNKGGGMDLGGFVSLLNNNANLQNSNNSNSMGLISGLMSNKNVMGEILNFFKGGGIALFGKKQKIKKELQTTDFEIKNYTRVE